MAARVRTANPLARRLAVGAALDAAVRNIVGDGDTDDLAALIATRDAQLALIDDVMREACAAVIDRGSHYTLAMLGRAARSVVSAEAARLNWACAVRRDWIAHRARLTSTPTGRTPG